MSEKPKARVGVAGLGYWGPKLARCFSELGVLACVQDTVPGRAQTVGESYPGVLRTTSYEEMLELVDHVVIATPPDLHYSMAAHALSAGKNVFVEKPLATRADEALQLETFAITNGLTLKVGHIYLHCPGIQMIPVPAGKAELYVTLLNTGGSPSLSTRELIWAGLPHAVSLAVRFFSDDPIGIGLCVSEHRVRVKLTYWNGSVAYLDVGDYALVKRRVVELRAGDARYSYNGDNPFDMYEWTAGKRIQSDMKPSGKKTEPLLLECEDFLENPGVDRAASVVVRLLCEIREKLNVIRNVAGYDSPH